MKPKEILSIDWDYFFPDSLPYDMGHSECHTTTMQEILWNHRTSAHNLLTGEALLDAYVPTIPERFWALVTNKPKVFVADSHFQIWKVLERGFLGQVTSLDAHHDCGYGSQKKNIVDCSNWGYWGRKTGLIGRLDLWYPAWRLTEDEQYGGRGKEFRPTTTNYSLPGPAEYDIVFICRSGAWTPPWFDEDFLKFASSLGSPVFLEELSSRGISKEKARELSAFWTEEHRKLIDSNH